VAPSSKFAYVVSWQDNAVSADAIDPTGGNLTLVRSHTAGVQPWRVTVDPSGKFAYVGNENSGTVSIYRINHDGSLVSEGITGTPEFDEKSSTHWPGNKVELPGFAAQLRCCKLRRDSNVI